MKIGRLSITARQNSWGGWSFVVEWATKVKKKAIVLDAKRMKDEIPVPPPSLDTIA